MKESLIIKSLETRSITKDKLDKEKLKSIISKFSEQHLVVVGDLILDEYLLGYPSRISREAPVLILKFIDSKFKLGGSSNAANNAIALGAKVTLIGVLGGDFASEHFKRICENAGINLIALTDPERYTTVKTRVVSTSNSNEDAGTVIKQQVLRIDRENQSPINENIENQILTELDKISDAKFVLISDYSNGVVTENLSKTAINQLKQKNIKAIVDSNSDFSKFSGAFSLTPNQPDLEKYLGEKIKEEKLFASLASEILEDLDLEVLLVTRGAKGMCVTAKEGSSFIPAFNLSEVFDVSGAGDTVAAAYSLSLASGASPEEAAIIGNLAASIVVKKYGTATTNQEELFELIDNLKI